MRMTRSLIFAFLFFICLPFSTNTNVFAHDVYIEDGVLKVVDGVPGYLYQVTISYDTDRFVIFNDNPNNMSGSNGCITTTSIEFQDTAECVIPQEDITEIYVEANGFANSYYNAATLNTPVTYYVDEVAATTLTAGSSTQDKLILDGNVEFVQYLGPEIEFGSADIQLANFENLEIHGSAGEDLISARYFEGNTVIYGYGEDDFLIGSETHSDILIPGAGDDYIDGKSGGIDELLINSDSNIDFTSDSDITGDFFLEIDRFELNGDASANIIDASDSPGSVVISSGTGADIVYTSDIDSVDNQVDLGGDNDSIYLGTGNVTINGGNGDDTIFATYNSDMTLTDSTLTISGVVTATISNLEAAQLTGGAGGGGSRNVTTNTSIFADIDGHTLEEYIANLFEDDIVNGYSDGLFHPDNYVTRAQMAKFLVLALGLTVDEQGDGFVDLDPTNPLNKYIKTLKNLGVTNGYADGTFEPEKGITRGEASKLLILALKAKGINIELNEEENIPFYDISKNYPFIEYIILLTKLKSADKSIVNGYSDGSFKPENYITRAEMAKIIDLARNV
jgi:hypothetical protein